jgi:hypothetical protein
VGGREDLGKGEVEGFLFEGAAADVREFGVLEALLDILLRFFNNFHFFFGYLFLILQPKITRHFQLIII